MIVYGLADERVGEAVELLRYLHYRGRGDAAARIAAAFAIE
jgi:hypothetical protein